MRTIRSQIMCLFALLMAAFLALGICWNRWESRRASELAKAAYRDKQTVINRLVELNGSSIKTLADDYTYWDEMVACIRTRDSVWASRNIDQALPVYKASAVWIFDTKGGEVYSKTIATGIGNARFQFNSESIHRFFDHSPFCHFFIRTPVGPLEIRGAAVHLTGDPKRKGPSYGYFFAGKLWGREYLNELGALADCRVSFAGPHDTLPSDGITPHSIYYYTLNLPGDNGKAATRILFTGEMSSLHLFQESVGTAAALFVLFSLLLGTALFMGLHRWVHSPLARLRESLRIQDTTPLVGMERTTDEYKELANLIETFFEQRQVLVGEVADRVQAETALLHAQRELEDRVLRRTAELEAAYTALQTEYEERKQAEDELTRAEAQLVQSAKLAALGTLSAGVAHELNQPVAVIRGLSQQLLDEPGISEDLAADLKLIEGQTTRMMKIISHLRTFSRASRGDHEVVDIESVVRNCFVIIGQQLKAHDIGVNLEGMKQGLYVMGDSNELEQVMLNFISNARDALEGYSRASITIQSRIVENSVVVTFRDNGPGISSQAAPHLFDPFFTTKEPGKGTGLGLSISHSIIEKHGGAIRAFNHAEGGAVFEITLPMAQADEEDGTAQLPTAA